MAAVRDDEPGVVCHGPVQHELVDVERATQALRGQRYAERLAGLRRGRGPKDAAGGQFPARSDPIGQLAGTNQGRTGKGGIGQIGGDYGGRWRKHAADTTRVPPALPRFAVESHGWPLGAGRGYTYPGRDQSSYDQAGAMAASRPISRACWLVRAGSQRACSRHEVVSGGLPPVNATRWR